MTLRGRHMLLGVVLLLALVPLFAAAADFRTGEQISLPADEVVNDDLYMAGGNVTSAGAIHGDLIIGGGNVLVSGPVTADLIAGGGTVTVIGDIGDDVRVGGGNVVIQGGVRGDVVIGGGQISLGGAGVGGDAALGGGAITVDAPVLGDLKIGGGEVTINARIAGNVEIHAEKVMLGKNARIEGNLTYSAREPATIAEGAVRGETVFKQRESVRNISKGEITALFSLALVVKFLMSLAGALALGYLFHRYSRELVGAAASQPLPEIGRGLVSFIVLPVASVILLITIVGIPIGILGLLSFAALVVFICIASPLVTGSIVHKWIWKPTGYQVDWKTILLGTFVYAVLGIIPFIGWLVQFGIFLLTLGAALKIKWSLVRDWL